MELIQIGENALKVSLTREDMEFYDIEFDMLDYKNTETRRALRSILDEAKRSFGFESACDKLYIQAFRSKCGGCELFVRREEEIDEENTPYLFRFDSMTLLLNGCARLYNCHHDLKSSVYLGNDDRFYLELHGEDVPLFLCEIANEVEYKKEYLSEHTTLICHDAIMTLSSLK